jgi:hypothetical protein
MGERGRQSTASLTVIPGGINQRPQAPADLSEPEAEIWDATVAHEAADVFATAALQQMLKDYCRHVVAADRLSKVIEGHMIPPVDEQEQISLKDLDCLLKMRDRETKAVADKATKLRLTNQSRYTPKAAGTAARNNGGAVKPWQVAS